MRGRAFRGAALLASVALIAGAAVPGRGLQQPEPAQPATAPLVEQPPAVLLPPPPPPPSLPPSPLPPPPPAAPPVPWYSKVSSLVWGKTVLSLVLVVVAAFLLLAYSMEPDAAQIIATYFFRCGWRFDYDQAERDYRAGFVRLGEEQAADQARKATVAEIFGSLAPQQHTGAVKVAALRDALAERGLNEHAIRMLITACDANADGLITPVEFRHAVTKHPQLELQPAEAVRASAFTKPEEAAASPAAPEPAAPEGVVAGSPRPPSSEAAAEAPGLTAEQEAAAVRLQAASRGASARKSRGHEA